MVYWIKSPVSNSKIVCISFGVFFSSYTMSAMSYTYRKINKNNNSSTLLNKYKNEKHNSWWVLYCY